MNLNVGIDVAKAKLDYCGMDSAKHIIFQDEVVNAPAGTEKIIKLILDWADSRDDAEKVVIGMEATSVYNIHPTLYFEQSSALQALDTEIVTLNPKMTHRYSQLFDDDKTDTLDAFHIADFLRMGRYQLPVTRDEKHIALQRLTRERYFVVSQITDCKNHFLNNLYFRLNTLEAELPTSVFGNTMMTVLSGEKYTLDEIAQMPLETLTQDLNQLSHGRFGEPEEVAKALKKAIRSSYRLNKTVADSVDQILAMYIREIRMFQKQLKELDKSIAALCAVIDGAKSLNSMPGLGPVYSAGLLAEIGQIERFPDEASLASYAGLSWRRSQSGGSERQLTPRTHNGDQYLRYYLVEAANSIRVHDPVFAKYYDKKYGEVPKYQHRRACIMTARKLVRVIYKLLSDHELYVPAKVV